MSRFITYPSTVEKSQDHTVVLIDADVNDIEKVGLFCKISKKDYDIYLYRGDLDDLEYLNFVVDCAEAVLIHEDSEVYIKNCKKMAKIGNHQEIVNALDYFLTYDTIEEKHG